MDEATENSINIQIARQLTGYEQVEIHRQKDFEHSHDACIRVCEDRGWEWERYVGFDGNGNLAAVYVISLYEYHGEVVDYLGSIAQAPTFAEALLAALEGDGE